MDPLIALSEESRARSFVPLLSLLQPGPVAPILPTPPSLPILYRSFSGSAPQDVVAVRPGIYEVKGSLETDGTNIGCVILGRVTGGQITPVLVDDQVASDHYVFNFQAYFATGDRLCVFIPYPKTLASPQSTVAAQVFPGTLQVLVTGQRTLLQFRYLGPA